MEAVPEVSKQTTPAPIVPGRACAVLLCGDSIGDGKAVGDQVARLMQGGALVAAAVDEAAAAALPGQVVVLPDPGGPVTKHLLGASARLGVPVTEILCCTASEATAAAADAAGAAVQLAAPFGAAAAAAVEAFVRGTAAAPLSAGPSIVAFDFDKCLMEKHWWGTYRNAALETINPAAADFAHPRIAELLGALLQHKQVGVAVASFGRKDVIRKALAAALGPELAKRVLVSTPGDYERSRDGQHIGNKNRQLQDIAAQYGVPIQRVAFFDDDSNNIIHAKRIGVRATVAAPMDDRFDAQILAHAFGPPPPPGPRSVVAFDFDKCLMEKHWWGTHRTNPIDTINPGPDDFAHPDIGQLFTELLNRPGVDLAVASFGRKDVIAKAIASVLPPELAARVFITTPGDFDKYSDGNHMGSKNRQLERVAKHFNVPIHRVCFFDDDAENIRHAVDFGVRAYVAAPFMDDDVEYIYEHLAGEGEGDDTE